MQFHCTITVCIIRYLIYRGINTSFSILLWAEKEFLVSSEEWRIFFSKLRLCFLSTKLENCNIFPFYVFASVYCWNIIGQHVVLDIQDITSTHGFIAYDLLEDRYFVFSLGLYFDISDRDIVYIFWVELHTLFSKSCWDMQAALFSPPHV